MRRCAPHCSSYNRCQDSCQAPKPVFVGQNRSFCIQDAKNILLETNQALTAENRELESTVTVLRKSVEDITSTRQSLESEKSRLEGEIVDVKVEKEELSELIQEITDEKEAFEVAYSLSKEKMTEELSRLEMKRDGVAQEIIRDQESQAIVSQNLANYQITLDKRDENLRIREEKVRQQEKLIIRNSNLLNL